MDGIIRPEDLEGVEIHEEDGIFLKQYVIPKAGSLIPQHAHVFSHLTMLVRGSVKVAHGNQIDHYDAPAGIHMPAGVKHTFLTLTNNVELWCVHNTMRRGYVEVLEEHNLVSVA